MTPRKYVFFAALFAVIAALGFAFIQYYRAKHVPSTALAHVSMEALTTTNNIVPIAIIGSGMAGLSAAVYGARSGIKTVVITGDKPGGALTETTYVENWPGNKRILGPQLVENIKKQAEALGADFLADAVDSVDFSSWPYTLRTTDGKTMKVLSVIVATGAEPRKLDVQGEKLFWGRGVTTCAICDAAFHKGKDVVVVGGGDSAVEEALQLAIYAKSIKILVRKDAMRASALMQNKLKAYDHISVVYNTQVQEIIGDGTGVTAVKILNNKTNEATVLPVSGVFLAIGSDPNVKLFKDQLKLESEGYLWTEGARPLTSVAGIFAAGDVQDRRYRQASVSSGDGVKAALEAIAFLHDHGFTTAVAKRLEPNYFDDFDLKRVELPLVNTMAELEQIFKRGKSVVVVDFYAPYCPSCMHMLPAVETVAYQLADKLTIVKVDKSLSSEISEFYKVTTIPCLIVFKNGRLVARHHNAMTRKELYAFLQKFVDEQEI